MTKVAAAVVAWRQTAVRHLRGRFKWKWLQRGKKGYQSTGGGGKGGSGSGDGGGMAANCRVPSSQQRNQRWKRRWWHGGNTAMQQHYGSLQRKMEVATNKTVNQAATLQRKWKW